MNQEIWLMRHGEPQKNGSLTQNGVQQSREAAKVFQGHEIVIYSSPAPRCQETATLLNDEIAQSVVHVIPWLNIATVFPEDCLSFLKGEIVVVVSHGPTLCKLAEILTLSSDHSADFDYAVPVKFYCA